MKALIDMAADQMWTGKTAFEHAGHSIIEPTYYEKAIYHTLRAIALTNMVIAAETLGLEETELPSSVYPPEG